jgi:Uncharacterized conserved protein
MTNRKDYTSAPATDARVEKQGEKWTLVLVRELHHPPKTVWDALTDPAQLSEWAPFDADRNLSVVGPVKLSTVNIPAPQVSESHVKRAIKPRLLEYTWGGNDLRWELESIDEGTRLTLWHNIDHRFVAWGAAGWHICIDVLDYLITGKPLGRMVGADAIKYGDWKRLVSEYSRQFGTETLDHNPMGENPDEREN